MHLPDSIHLSGSCASRRTHTSICLCPSRSRETRTRLHNAYQILSKDRIPHAAGVHTFICANPVPFPSPFSTSSSISFNITCIIDSNKNTSSRPALIVPQQPLLSSCIYFSLMMASAATRTPKPCLFFLLAFRGVSDGQIRVWSTSSPPQINRFLACQLSTNRAFFPSCNSTLPLLLLIDFLSAR